MLSRTAAKSVARRAAAKTPAAAARRAYVRESVLAANRRYADKFDKGDLQLPPAKRAVLLTCMDARLDPAKFGGFEEGDVHVIRNAGGRASDDAIRSIIISHKLLGTREIFVAHHTNCGMELFENDDAHRLLAESVDTATLESDGTWTNRGARPGTGHAEAAREIDFLTIKGCHADRDDAVVEDVARIRDHPLVPRHVPVYGFVYDVATGRLNEVAAATARGAPLEPAPEAAAA